MKSLETRITQKYQTAIPKEVRKHLKKPKDTVMWHVSREMVVVDSHKKMEDPVGFLTSQLRKGVTLDAVKLVRKTREEDFG
jgi:bifunctional DNA-binding transcriptional regulator/antitoxin component of YhaV-PrlF toxin-antitoxin module